MATAVEMIMMINNLNLIRWLKRILNNEILTKLPLQVQVKIVSRSSGLDQNNNAQSLNVVLPQQQQQQHYNDSG